MKWSQQTFLIHSSTKHNWKWFSEIESQRLQNIQIQIQIQNYPQMMKKYNRQRILHWCYYDHDQHLGTCGTKLKQKLRPIIIELRQFYWNLNFQNIEEREKRCKWSQCQNYINNVDAARCQQQYKILLYCNIFTVVRVMESGYWCLKHVVMLWTNTLTMWEHDGYTLLTLIMCNFHFKVKIVPGEEHL